MADTSLNLKNILKEEQKAKLSALDKDFYEKAHALFREIKAEIEKTDPENMKHGLLTSELKVSKINFEEILDIRRGKIIKEASIQSLKHKEQHEPENLIPVEKKLYDELFASLIAWRKDRLHEKKKEPAAPVKKAEPAIDLKKDYMMVRMLLTVPTFVGADARNYTLGKEDIATVPAVNAMALISKKAAVQVGVK